MENSIRLITLIHRITLTILLLLIAVIPLIIEINLVTAFVTLPTFIIFIFSVSIVIEQKLSAISLKARKDKKKQRCLILNCLHKNCLG